ncbi:S10 family serine carboxypeptidase-like protein [Burkholderia anthina]|uniref:S10 family serine carboxypeptidase-like protein n=1 Tax=Burkholderia anthina TaxID=179879 RepID=UPI00158E9A36|nr:hypothetical protein [Burkholderia anthina]
MTTMHAAGEFTGKYFGRKLNYRFSMDMMQVKKDDGETAGTMSVFSYVAEVPPEERAIRPVIFAFNGGPGSASTFLHLGGLGPKHISFPENLSVGVHSHSEMCDNEFTVLAAADLVFIDPINTGYGRQQPNADVSELYSLQGDARAFAKVVKQWVSQNGRWSAPKYILGESYGTHRAVFLASSLMDDLSIPLNGIILIGQAVNVQETRDRPGNVTSLIASLPFMAATAWFHGLGSKHCDSVEQAVAEAIELSHGEFATILHAGNRAAPAAVEAMARRLSAMTGLKSELFSKRRFWVNKEQFRRELLAEEGLIVGLSDARYVGRAPDVLNGEGEIEPSMAQIRPAFAAFGACYLYAHFGTAVDLPEYREFDPMAVARWDWSDDGARHFMSMGKPSPFLVYPYVARLTKYLKQVSHAKLFIGTGYYDALTTVGAVEHLLRQYELPCERVTDKRYPGGHMMYTDHKSREQLNKDLITFVSE